jgi:hypothetical protein
MAQRLLVVKDAFPARGSGVEVLPAIASDSLPPSPFDVTLRHSNGSERRVKATAILAHIRGPLPPLAMIRLEDVAVDAVPSGTEIWSAW